MPTPEVPGARSRRKKNSTAAKEPADPHPPAPTGSERLRSYFPGRSRPAQRASSPPVPTRPCGFATNRAGPLQPRPLGPTRCVPCARKPCAARSVSLVSPAPVRLGPTHDASPCARSARNELPWFPTPRSGLGSPRGPRRALGGASAGGACHRARGPHDAAPRRPRQRGRALHPQGPTGRDPQCPGERHREVHGPGRCALRTHSGRNRDASSRARVHSSARAHTLAHPLAEETTGAWPCRLPRTR